MVAPLLQGKAAIENTPHDHGDFRCRGKQLIIRRIMGEYDLMAFLYQSTIYFFVKHHRAHHVFLDTHADPQNSKRGFWFSQLGWRLVKERPEYKEKVKTLEYNDVLSDPVVRFQKM